MYLNKAFIYGNITRDPEVRALPSGMKVCNLSVATNRVWKDKNGVKQDSVDYHNVVMFGKTADVAAQYLRKGSAVYVEGRMQTRSWDAQDGQKKYRTEIIADSFQFGPKVGGGTGSASSASTTSTQDSPVADKTKKGGEKAGPSEDTIDYPEEEINAEDIPF